MMTGLVADWRNRGPLGLVDHAEPSSTTMIPAGPTGSIMSTRQSWLSQTSCRGYAADLLAASVATAGISSSALREPATARGTTMQLASRGGKIRAY